MYIIQIITYDGAAWAPFVTRSQWRQLEALQTIVIQMVTGMPQYLRNNVLLKQTNSITIEQTIKQQSRTNFYTNQQSIFKL